MPLACMLMHEARGSCCSCMLQGLTPLQLATRNNAYGALEVLLLQSADVDLQDRRVRVHNSICHCSPILGLGEGSQT